MVVTTIGSLGDLHPKIAVALELRKRGHDVVFATHQDIKKKLKLWDSSFIECALTTLL